MPAEPNTRDAKLIQYLNEAYATERQLETELSTHIKMAKRPAYKKRLQQHLKETKAHARQLKARISKLGGTAHEVAVPGPEAVTGVAARTQTVARKGAALARGPLDALRGTSEEEQQLKNAKTEYAREALQIAMYTGIVAFAEQVGDKETAKLAKGILREEERMAKYLAGLIPTLSKAVVTREVPRAERTQNGSRAASSRRTSPSSSGTSRRKAPAKRASARKS